MSRFTSKKGAVGPFRGLLHALIAKRSPSPPEFSSGMTWRAAAAILKLYRGDREGGRDLGLDLKELAPREP